MERTRTAELLRDLGDGWRLNADGHLERTYVFANFANAMAFANKVADIAEAADHHPDLHIAWGKCRVEIWTHQIDGLSERDFSLAAKTELAFTAT
jgi:4a-hydroxytetrahydrobiopterin dehydratase